MDRYAKPHSSISGSSLMGLPVATRWVWVFMLSQADAHGVVQTSVTGLARAAGVTLKQCQAALNVFLAPNRYSRTTAFEGRRLVEVAGGWKLLAKQVG